MSDTGNETVSLPRGAHTRLIRALGSQTVGGVTGRVPTVGADAQITRCPVGAHVDSTCNRLSHWMVMKRRQGRLAGPRQGRRIDGEFVRTYQMHRKEKSRGLGAKCPAV